MNAMKIKSQRKNKIIKDIEKRIQEGIVNMGRKETIIFCLDDLYEEIKQYFEKKGFKLRKEKYEISDHEGWGTGEYDYNYYIRI